MATSFYDTEKFEDKGRSIRLNEIKQKMPEGRFKVADAKKQKALNSDVQYPILVLQDEDGNRYEVMAWERDVKECGRQWAGTHPTDWGFVEFRLSSTGTRFEIVPAEDQSEPEEQVGKKGKK